MVIVHADGIDLGFKDGSVKGLIPNTILREDGSIMLRSSRKVYGFVVGTRKQFEQNIFNHVKKQFPYENRIMLERVIYQGVKLDSWSM
jgi:hypothetical protein